MKAMLISTIAFCILACHSQEKLLTDFDSESKSLVDSLNIYKSVESEKIGYSGEESKAYQLFIQMKDKFEPKKLVALTNHKNPVIRAYAFWALCLNRYPDFERILESHLRDKEKFWYVQGCFIDPERVNSFYLMLLNPENTVYDGIKLSKEKYEMYASKIK